jgi:uncharacterized protein YraI
MGTLLPSTTTTSAASVDGPVYAITHDVIIRSGPVTSARTLGTIPAGADVPVQCTTRGQLVTDIYGPDASWDKVTYNGIVGFVTDEWVDTKGAETNPAIIPPCS